MRKLLLSAAITLIPYVSHANDISDAIDRQTQALQQMEMDRQFNETQKNIGNMGIDTDRELLEDQKLLQCINPGCL